MRSQRKPSAAASARNGHALGLRDQVASTFGLILERLVRSVLGAHAAALVDAEGETVDYAGDLDPFDIKVAAAHWRIVLSEIGESFGGIRQIIARAQRKSYVVRQIHTEYMIVVVLHRRAGFSASERALQEAHVRLCIEAGFPPPQTSIRWFGVDVEPDVKDRCRPAKLRVAATWQPVEVMGSVMGLVGREKGFRVRLPSGAEMSLVRERLGHWFADERVEE